LYGIQRTASVSLRQATSLPIPIPARSRSWVPRSCPVRNVWGCSRPTANRQRYPGASAVCRAQGPPTRGAPIPHPRPSLRSLRHTTTLRANSPYELERGRSHVSGGEGVRGRPRVFVRVRSSAHTQRLAVAASPQPKRPTGRGKACRSSSPHYDSLMVVYQTRPTHLTHARTQSPQYGITTTWGPEKESLNLLRPEHLPAAAGLRNRSCLLHL
jgi:hypothetical protein